MNTQTWNTQNNGRLLTNLPKYAMCRYLAGGGCIRHNEFRDQLVEYIAGFVHWGHVFRMYVPL